MTNIDSPEYWSTRYRENNTPWDIGYASPPITEYFTKLMSRDQRILIPGAGNAHEAVWLWQEGFKKIWVADMAPEPLNELQRQLPDFPKDQLLLKDFFDLNMQFDLIIEQTFFCALRPDRRSDYVAKMRELLMPEGMLLGVLFNFPLTEQGPPFGGSIDEYQDLFSHGFKIKTLETCYNSIKPRQGNELFVQLVKD